MSDTVNPLEVVRVKDPTSGAEYSTTRAHAKNAGLEVLDGKAAVDDYGRLIPTKPRTDLAGQPVSTGVTEKSSHEEIDAYALERNVDLTGASTRAEKIAAIAAADTTTEA